MPTIKDIAKYAGVSHGTVSNVLNHKGNVSAEKIKLVEQAAKELGYKFNSQASQLRSGTSKNVCVIVPRIDKVKYSKVYAGIENELCQHDIKLELICTNGLHYVEKQVLNKALESNPMAVILVSSSLKNKETVPEGTQIVMLDRYVRGFPESAVFVSFNYEKAGREIAEKCVKDGNKSVAILCESMSYTCDKKFVGAATNILESEGCYCEVFSGLDFMKLNSAFDILYAADAFDAIIVMSEEDVDSLKMAHRYNPDLKIPSIYAVVNKEIGLTDGNMYEMDYKLMGRHIAEMVLEKKEEPFSIEPFSIDGSFKKGTNFLTKKEETIRFLTVKNATSKAIKCLLPLFCKQSGINVKVIEVPYDELYKMVLKISANDETIFDLVRIDMAWIPKEGQLIFQKIDRDNKYMCNVMGKLLPNIPDEYSTVNGIQYTIPLDACVQMLFCRKDIFENELIKRGFYEKYRRKLEIPRTFEEYNQVARFFTQKYHKHSPTMYGNTLTYGRSFVAACEVLLRFYEKDVSLFDDSGNLKIFTQEMKEAFQNCLEAYKYATNDTHMWWREAAKMFSEGNVAMNITFSNYASDMVHQVNSKVAGKITYSEVPGGHPLLGGGSIGITKSSNKVNECYRFFEWLYSDEISEMITYLGGFIPNRNIIKNAEILELYPWFENIEDMMQKGRRNNQSKNPKFNEFVFEDIIGTALMTSILEATNCDEALIQAQKNCDNMF